MKKHCKVVWQLHDPLSYIPHPIKALYQRFCFYRHYGYYGRFAHIFSVSEENVDFVHRFNKQPITFIPNGTDTERLHITFERSRKPFIFLAFGGRNISKRIDLLIRAAQLLHKQQEQNFEVWLTNGTDTQKVVREIVGNNFPSWLKIVEQQADVSKLYDRVSCFVSTSEHETFSYAICEASISGLPVVQSDIEPTMWNAGNPSTFVFHFPDIKNLAEQMKKVMEYDPAQLEERCRKTSKTNFRKYSLETWATKVIDFYRSL
jgi:putative glycosyltransferase